MPITLPETWENERVTSKYHEKTDTKVSGYISVVFGSNKIIFFADQSCFFSATVSDNHDLSLISALLYLGGGVGEILRQLCLPPHLRAGWAWGCGWLGPPLSFVPANTWVGAGVKGQPLQMTIYAYLTSYARFPQDLSPLTRSLPNNISNCFAVSPLILKRLLLTTEE